MHQGTALLGWLPAIAPRTRRCAYGCGPSRSARSSASDALDLLDDAVVSLGPGVGVAELQEPFDLGGPLHVVVWLPIWTCSYSNRRQRLTWRLPDGLKPSRQKVSGSILAFDMRTACRSRVIRAFLSSQPHAEIHASPPCVSCRTINGRNNGRPSRKNNAYRYPTELALLKAFKSTPPAGADAKATGSWRGDLDLTNRGLLRT